MPSFFKADMPTRVDRATAKAKAADANWRRVCAAVDARDGRACRCCGKRTNANAVGLLRGHRHHIVYRSAGGADDSRNICTLCPTCHDDEHVKRTLQVEGNADEWLIFTRRRATDGSWHIARLEVAPGVVDNN